MPRDIGARNADGQWTAERADFAFVRSDQRDRLAIATLNLKPDATHPLTVYFLNLAADRIWENQLGSPRSPATTAISSSPAAAFFLMGITARSGDPTDYVLINSAEFHRANLSKNRLKPPTWDDRTLSFPSPVGMKPAFSDNGRWCAIAEAESGPSSIAPSVKICSADPASKWELKLDFEPHRNTLTPDWRISGLSFDREAKSLVVGFAAKPFLIVCALPDLPPPRLLVDQNESSRPHLSTTLMKLTGTPLGWAHCSDGKHIAIISNGQIFIDDLAAWRDKEQTPKVLFDQDTKNATCVAFGPKGTVLATGDAGGVIAVRSISMPAGANGQSEGKSLSGTSSCGSSTWGRSRSLHSAPTGVSWQHSHHQQNRSERSRPG